MSQDQQKEAFLTEAQKLGLDQPTETPPPPPIPGMKPIDDPAPAPFNTSLRLSREQLERLEKHCVDSIQVLSNENGRQFLPLNGLGYTPGTVNNLMGQMPTSIAEMMWMLKRITFDQMYANHAEWRAWVLGGIYRQSNLIVPVSRRVTRQMAARAINYFFSTAPWFSATPEGKQDDGLADKLDKYAQWKVERSPIEAELRKAIELAFVRGEAVLKTIHVSKETIYKTTAKVLVDADGGFILDANGDYIFGGNDDPRKDDAWAPQPPDPNAPPPAAPGLLAKAKGFFMGTPAAQPPPLFLKKDGLQTPQPPVPIYVERHITRKITLYRGPQASVVYFGDMLIPLTCANLQDAPFIAQIFETPVMNIANFYTLRDMLYGKPDDTLDRLKESVRLVQDMQASVVPKVASDQPNFVAGEIQNDALPQNPTVELAECWLTYAPEDDGVMSELMVVIDRGTGKAVFYDYAANLTWDGKRPFQAIVINPVDGRWHGMGAMEMFCTSQEAIDLNWNRFNFAISGSGRVTFADMSKTREGQMDPTLRMNHGGTYTPLDGVKAEEILSYVSLPNLKAEELDKVVQFYIQLIQTESGVTNAGDQQVSGLPSQKLATGIRDIARGGEEMFGIYLGQLEPGLQSVVDAVLGVTLANLDRKEVFNFLDGDTKGVADITPEEVQNLTLKVKLLLSRYRGEQVLDSNAAAAERVKEFYELPPAVQVIVAPFYRQMLKALQVQDADQAIQPVPPQPAAPPPEPESLAINYKDVPDSIKRQMESKAGFTPASPEEAAASAAAAQTPGAMAPKPGVQQPAKPSTPTQPKPSPRPAEQAALAAKPPGQVPSPV